MLTAKSAFKTIKDYLYIFLYFLFVVWIDLVCFFGGVYVPYLFISNLFHPTVKVSFGRLGVFYIFVVVAFWFTAYHFTKKFISEFWVRILKKQPIPEVTTADEVVDETVFSVASRVLKNDKK